MELQPGIAQFGSKLVIFLSPVTSNFDKWPWQTIRHIFAAISSFALHFIAIYQLKMELQSGNAKFGSKSAIFCPGWPWILTDDLGKQYGSSSMLLCVSFNSLLWNENVVTFRKHQIWVKIDDFFVPCDLDRWHWKINRAPLLCYFKLCASFHSHLWIQNGVTFWKRQIWVKIGDLLSHVTLKFGGWP